MSKVHVKTGDTVVILSGKDRGKKGKIMAVSPKEGKVIVENANIVSKHVKPRKMGEAGGIIKAESAIYACKVQVVCPRCGKPVYEGKKNFACSDRACQFVMWKNDRFWTSRRKEMTRKMAADLLKKGRTSVKGMWSEKKGSTYDAVVILDDTGGKYVNFKLEFPKRKDGVHGKK